MMTYLSLSIIIEEPDGLDSSIDHKYKIHLEKKNVNRRRRNSADMVVWRRFGLLLLLETL